MKQTDDDDDDDDDIMQKRTAGGHEDVHTIHRVRSESGRMLYRKSIERGDSHENRGVDEIAILLKNSSIGDKKQDKDTYASCVDDGDGRETHKDGIVVVDYATETYRKVQALLSENHQSRALDGAHAHELVRFWPRKVLRKVDLLWGRDDRGDEKHGLDYFRKKLLLQDKGRGRRRGRGSDPLKHVSETSRVVLKKYLLGDLAARPWYSATSVLSPSRMHIYPPKDEGELNAADVLQGDLGDCYFAAGLSLLAEHYGKCLRDRIEFDEEKREFVVRLWHQRHGTCNSPSKRMRDGPIKTRVNEFYFTHTRRNRKGKAGAPLYCRSRSQSAYPGILEKAWLYYRTNWKGGDSKSKRRQGGGTTKNTTLSLPPSYEDIANGQGFDASDVLHVFTGLETMSEVIADERQRSHWSPCQRKSRSDTLWSILSTALSTGRAVSGGTREVGNGRHKMRASEWNKTAPPELLTHHNYCILDAGIDEKFGRFLICRNPQGEQTSPFLMSTSCSWPPPSLECKRDSTDEHEGESLRRDGVFRLAFQDFIAYFKTISPQHGSHLDDGWTFGYTDSIGKAAIDAAFAPPQPPAVKCPPNKCCDPITCAPDPSTGECCENAEDEIEKPPTEPEPQNRDYRKPPPFVDFNLDGMCKPKPCAVEPSEGPTTGGVRVTVRGEFLANSLDDVEIIRICGAPCVDIRREKYDGDVEMPGGVCNATLSVEEPIPKPSEPEELPCWIEELQLDSEGSYMALDEFFLFRPTTKLAPSSSSSLLAEEDGLDEEEQRMDPSERISDGVNDDSPPPSSMPKSDASMQQVDEGTPLTEPRFDAYNKMMSQVPEPVPERIIRAQMERDPGISDEDVEIFFKTSSAKPTASTTATEIATVAVNDEQTDLLADSRFDLYKAMMARIPKPPKFIVKSQMRSDPSISDEDIEVFFNTPLPSVSTEEVPREIPPPPPLLLPGAKPSTTTESDGTKGVLDETEVADVDETEVVDVDESSSAKRQRDPNAVARAKQLLEDNERRAREPYAPELCIVRAVKTAQGQRFEKPFCVVQKREIDVMHRMYEIYQSLPFCQMARVRDIAAFVDARRNMAVVVEEEQDAQTGNVGGEESVSSPVELSTVGKKALWSEDAGRRADGEDRTRLKGTLLRSKNMKRRGGLKRTKAAHPSQFLYIDRNGKCREEESEYACLRGPINMYKCEWDKTANVCVEKSPAEQRLAKQQKNIRDKLICQSTTVEKKKCRLVCSDAECQGSIFNNIPRKERWLLAEKHVRMSSSCCKTKQRGFCDRCCPPPSSPSVSPACENEIGKSELSTSSSVFLEHFESDDRLHDLLLPSLDMLAPDADPDYDKEKADVASFAATVSSSSILSSSKTTDTAQNDAHHTLFKFKARAPTPTPRDEYNDTPPPPPPTSTYNEDTLPTPENLQDSASSYELNRPLPPDEEVNDPGPPVDLDGDESCTDGGPGSAYKKQPDRPETKGICKPREECMTTPTENRNGATRCSGSSVCCSKTLCEDSSRTDEERFGFCAREKACDSLEGWHRVSDTIVNQKGNRPDATATGCRHLPYDVTCCVKDPPPPIYPCTGGEGVEFRGQPASEVVSEGTCMLPETCELTVTKKTNGATGCEPVEDTDGMICCSEVVCKDSTDPERVGFCTTQENCDKRDDGDWVRVSDTIMKEKDAKRADAVAEGCRHLPDEIMCCLPPPKPPTPVEVVVKPEPSNNCTGGEHVEIPGRGDEVEPQLRRDASEGTCVPRRECTQKTPTDTAHGATGCEHWEKTNPKDDFVCCSETSCVIKDGGTEESGVCLAVDACASDETKESFDDVLDGGKATGCRHLTDTSVKCCANPIPTKPDVPDPLPDPIEEEPDLPPGLPVLAGDCETNEGTRFLLPKLDANNSVGLFCVLPGRRQPPTNGFRGVPTEFWNLFDMPRDPRKIFGIHPGGVSGHFGDSREEEIDGLRPLPDGWTVLFDDMGRRYYNKASTADSRWGHPSLPRGWTEVTDFTKVDAPISYYAHRSMHTSRTFPLGEAFIREKDPTKANKEGDEETFGSSKLDRPVCCVSKSSVKGRRDKCFAVSPTPAFADEDVSAVAPSPQERCLDSFNGNKDIIAIEDEYDIQACCRPYYQRKRNACATSDCYDRAKRRLKAKRLAATAKIAHSMQVVENRAIQMGVSVFSGYKSVCCAKTGGLFRRDRCQHVSKVEYCGRDYTPMLFADAAKCCRGIDIRSVNESAPIDEADENVDVTCISRGCAAAGRRVVDEGAHIRPKSIWEVNDDDSKINNEAESVDNPTDMDASTTVSTAIVEDGASRKGGNDEANQKGGNDDGVSPKKAATTTLQLEGTEGGELEDTTQVRFRSLRRRRVVRLQSRDDATTLLPSSPPSPMLSSSSVRSQREERNDDDRALFKFKATIGAPTPTPTPPTGYGSSDGSSSDMDERTPANQEYGSHRPDSYDDRSTSAGRNSAGDSFFRPFDGTNANSYGNVDDGASPPLGQKSGAVSSPLFGGTRDKNAYDGSDRTAQISDLTANPKPSTTTTCGHGGVCMLREEDCSDLVVTPEAEASACPNELPFCCDRVPCTPNRADPTSDAYSSEHSTTPRTPSSSISGSCLPSAKCNKAEWVADASACVTEGIDDPDVVCCYDPNAVPAAVVDATEHDETGPARKKGGVDTPCEPGTWEWTCPDDLWCAGTVYCRPCQPKTVDECNNALDLGDEADNLSGLVFAVTAQERDSFPSAKEMKPEYFLGDCVALSSVDVYVSVMPDSWKTNCIDNPKEVVEREDGTELAEDVALEDICPEGCVSCDGVPMGGNECLSCERGYNFLARPMRIDGWRFGSCQKRGSGSETEDCGDCPEGTCDKKCPKSCKCCLKSCTNDPSCDISKSCVSCAHDHVLVVEDSSNDEETSAASKGTDGAPPPPTELQEQEEDHAVSTSDTGDGPKGGKGVSAPTPELREQEENSAVTTNNASDSGLALTPNNATDKKDPLLAGRCVNENQVEDDNFDGPVQVLSCTTGDASALGDLSSTANFVYIRSKGCLEIRSDESTKFRCQAPPIPGKAKEESHADAYARMIKNSDRESLPPEQQPVCCVSLEGAILSDKGDENVDEKDDAASSSASPNPRDKTRLGATNAKDEKKKKKKKKEKKNDPVAECLVELGGKTCPDGFVQVSHKDAFNPTAFDDHDEREHFIEACKMRKTEFECHILSDEDMEKGNVCEWASKKKTCLPRERCCSFFTAPNRVGPTRCMRKTCEVETMPENNGERCCVAPVALLDGTKKKRKKKKKTVLQGDDVDLPTHHCLISRGPCPAPYISSEVQGPLQGTCCGGFYPNLKKGTCILPVNVEELTAAANETKRSDDSDKTPPHPKKKKSGSGNGEDRKPGDGEDREPGVDQTASSTNDGEGTKLDASRATMKKSDPSGSSEEVDRTTIPSTTTNDETQKYKVDDNASGSVVAPSSDSAKVLNDVVAASLSVDSSTTAQCMPPVTACCVREYDSVLDNKMGGAIDSKAWLKAKISGKNQVTDQCLALEAGGRVLDSDNTFNKELGKAECPHKEGFVRVQDHMADRCCAFWRETGDVTGQCSAPGCLFAREVDAPPEDDLRGWLPPPPGSAVEAAKNPRVRIRRVKKKPPEKAKKKLNMFADVFAPSSVKLKRWKRTAMDCSRYSTKSDCDQSNLCVWEASTDVCEMPNTPTLCGKLERVEACGSISTSIPDVCGRYCTSSGWFASSEFYRCYWDGNSCKNGNKLAVKGTDDNPHFCEDSVCGTHAAPGLATQLSASDDYYLQFG
eukprot:g1577.t1